MNKLTVAKFNLLGKEHEVSLHFGDIVISIKGQKPIYMAVEEAEMLSAALQAACTMQRK